MRNSVPTSGCAKNWNHVTILQHKQETSDDINYIIEGIGQAVCDSRKESLQAAVCHVCPKGSEHSIVNTGTEDLVMLTVVVER